MQKIITPVVTPLNGSGEIDYDATKRVIDFLVENGVDGILVFGTMGEFIGFGMEEKIEYLRFYSDYVNGKVKLFAGTGSSNSKETIQMSKIATECGYQASVIIAPYYYHATQKQLYVYYNEIVKEIDGNVLLYNFPARTGYSMDVSIILELVKGNKNIVGIKDSVIDIAHTSSIKNQIENERFEVYSGFDNHFLNNMSFRGAGCIGGLSNIVPDLWSDLVKYTNDKEYDIAIKLFSLVDELMPLYSLPCSTAKLFKMLMKTRGISISSQTMFPYNEVEAIDFEYAKDLLDKVLTKYNQMIIS